MSEGYLNWHELISNTGSTSGLLQQDSYSFRHIVEAVFNYVGRI